MCVFNWVLRLKKEKVKKSAEITSCYKMLHGNKSKRVLHPKKVRFKIISKFFKTVLGPLEHCPQNHHKPSKSSLKKV